MAIRLWLKSLITVWDMEKFHDSIDFTILMEEAEALGYSGSNSSLGLQVHMAARGLRCYKAQK